MKVLILIFAILAICYANSIKDEIMMRVDQINTIKDKFAEARAGFQEFHQEARNIHLSNQQIFHEISTKRDVLSRASQQCSTAVVNLVNLVTNSTCTNYFKTYFDVASTTQQRSDAITNFCSTCQTQFRDAVTGVITNCNITDFNYDVIKAVGFYQRFLCSKDAKGNLCAVVLNNAVSSIPADITQVTATQLDNFCSPCILKALTLLQAASGISAGQAFYNAVIVLKGACVKFNGVYCILKLRDVIKSATAVAQKFATNQTVTSADITTLLDAFCTPCFRLVVARLSLSSSGLNSLSIASAFSGLGPLCRKNPAKQYCIAVLFDIAKDYFLNPKGIPCDFGNGTTCSQSCKDLITTLINKGGCCWAVLVDTISGVGPGADSSVKNAIYTSFRNCVPGLKIPEPCPSVATANLKLVYSNILTSWIQSNTNTFFAYVKADVSRSVGGLDNDGNYTIAYNKRGDTTVTITGATTVGTAGGALAVPIGCDQTCSNAIAVDPNSDIALTSTVSNLSITSSSNIIGFSFALLAILSVFLF